MQLAFDIGNSAVKGGAFLESQLQHTFRTAHDAEAISAAIDAAVERRTVAWAGITSVVPDSTRLVVQLLDERDIAAVVVRHDMRLPFRLDYRTPETLGSDRLAAAAAAWLLFGARRTRSVIALDAGTAVTCEVVDRHGVYLGGTIAPGPVLMQRALNRETAQLPEVPLELPASAVGRSTVEAIQSGTMYGFVESVGGLLRRIADEIGDEPYVVATGGWGTLLHDRIDAIDSIEPHLVLEGARRIVEMNT